jgi:hypothetical protein
MKFSILDFGFSNAGSGNANPQTKYPPDAQLDRRQRLLGQSATRRVETPAAR